MPKIVDYALPPGGTIVQVADNNPIALDIEQAGADYITVDTTNGSEQVIIGKLLTLEGGMAFSGATTFAIPDNTQNAFVIENATGGADYVNIDTRDGQEIVQLAVEGTAGLEVHVSSGNAEVRLADEVGFINDPDLMIRRRTTNELEFRIAGSDIFRVNASGIMVETGSIEIETNSPTLTLDNSTAEDGDGGRESQIDFTGLRSGSEAHTLARVQVSHDGAADDDKGKISFLTNDGSSVSEAVRIDSAGKVGVGSTSPAGFLEVECPDSANVPAILVDQDDTTNNPYAIEIQNAGTGDSIRDDSGAKLTAAGVFTDASDIALKSDIETIPYGLETVLQLQPVSYDLKKTGQADIGFIAQEVEQLIPEVVFGENGSKSLSYGHLVAVLTRALQEMHARIEELENGN